MAKERQELVEWVGGSYPSPKAVLERGVPTRAEVAIWIIQPGSVVVNTAVGLSPMPPDAVANALTETLELPLPPQKGLRVRVSDPAVADAVRRQLGNAVPVVVEPTPDLDAIAASLQRFLGRMRRPRDRGYLQRGQIPPDDVAWLFRAAAEVWTVAPWRFASDDQVLALNVPALGIANACVSILGQLGESFGFVVFESFDAFARFADQMPDDGSDPDGIDMSGCVAALDFGHRRDLSKVRRREIQTHGWTVAAPDAHPHVVCARADGMPRAETADEVRLVAACAEALAAFCRRHVDVFAHEPTVPRTEAVEIHAPGGSMIADVTAPHPALLSERAAAAPPPPRVGRNDPCPCGSGRKYKKCHLDDRPTVSSVPSSPAQVRELDYRMMQALLTFGEVRQRAAALGPDVRLTGHPEFDGPWLAFHERIGGQRLVDRFGKSRRHALDATERAWLVAQQEVRLSVWDVLDVVPGTSLELRDQFTGESCLVSDDVVSDRTHRGDRILARVLELAGFAIFSGVHGHALRPSAASRVVRTVRRLLGTRARVVATEALRVPLIEHALRDAWEDACTVEVEKLQDTRLANTDGHALLLTVDHFVFAEAARREVEARIEQIAERIDDDADTVKTRFDVWAASNNVAGLERISLAHIEMRNAALRIETNSRERADFIRSLVEGACGSLIEHRAREHSDPRAPIGQTSAPPKPGVAQSPEAMQLVLDFKRKHYSTWPDEPLPALGGLTPREAASRPAMHRRLTLLLADMEHAEEPLPAPERFDFGALRAALGLGR